MTPPKTSECPLKRGHFKGRGSSSNHLSSRGHFSGEWKLARIFEEEGYHPAIIPNKSKQILDFFDHKKHGTSLANLQILSSSLLRFGEVVF